MKNKIIALFVLFCASVNASELIEKKFYDIGKVEVDTNCPAYPVVKMIEALLKKDLEAAKKFGTTGYSKYVELRTEGWDSKAKQYHTEWDRSEAISFKYYPFRGAPGDIKVAVYFPVPGATADRKFRVRKVDGKYLVVAYR